MIRLRKSDERGWADHGWLQSHHSFSFASYQDPEFMGWGNLRVINEDRIAPGSGFGTHGHRDMEIISYVLSGELAHRDSMGHVQTIPAGDVQRMSAGTGVMHSEFNHAQATTHFFQIWIFPDAQGLAPGYEQRHVSDSDKRGRLTRLVDGQRRDKALGMNADACIWLGSFDGPESARLDGLGDRKVWVQLLKGRLEVNGHALQPGDALMMAQEPEVDLRHGEGAEVLVFDLQP